jgi:2-methylcitrate dehydratase PrpD
MAENTKQLASFVYNSKFSELPNDVIHQSKRALLDAVGCAFAGMSMQASRIAVQFAKRSGGRKESTIIGTGDKVPCPNAAFANAQLINAQDFDPGSIGHDSPGIVGAVLAAAEATRASGQDLILAIALGHELATRMKAAEPLPGPDSGTGNQEPNPEYAFVTVAVSAACGKLFGISQDQIRHAMGIASFTHPPCNSLQRYFDISPVWNVKYTVFGRIAEAGVTAALMAKMGFTGDPEVLDSKTCFWKPGGQAWQPEKMSEGLGQWKHIMRYKRFPSNRPTAGAKDCFIALVEENDIKPDEIEKITFRARPECLSKPIRDNQLMTEEDYCFNIPYQLGCAAYRIKPTRWLDKETRQDSRIRSFMQRVRFDIGFDKGEFELAKKKDPRAIYMSAEILARGETFKKSSLHVRGQDWPAEFRFTDEELIEKFKENVSPVLSEDAADEAAAAILKMEGFTRINDVTKLLRPDRD